MTQKSNKFLTIALILLVGGILFYVYQNQALSPSEAPIKSEDTQEVTGALIYLNQPQNNFYAYRSSAINRVCFEPAQLETINEGQLFCFQDTSRIMDMMGVKKTNDKCEYYARSATVLISGLTDKNLNITRADPCFEEGSCAFNEANLEEVVEFFEEAPICSD